MVEGGNLEGGKVRLMMADGRGKQRGVRIYYVGDERLPSIIIGSKNEKRENNFPEARVMWCGVLVSVCGAK